MAIQLMHGRYATLLPTLNKLSLKKLQFLTLALQDFRAVRYVTCICIKHTHRYDYNTRLNNGPKTNPFRGIRSINMCNDAHLVSWTLPSRLGCV